MRQPPEDPPIEMTKAEKRKLIILGIALGAGALAYFEFLPWWIVTVGQWLVNLMR